MTTPLKSLKQALFVGLLLLQAATARACPVCSSETGKEVRAGIFNDDFASNVLMTLLPFPVVLGIVAAIHFAFTPKRGDLPPRASRETPEAERSVS